jgi:hypothetical protein
MNRVRRWTVLVLVIGGGLAGCATSPNGALPWWADVNTARTLSEIEANRAYSRALQSEIDANREYSRALKSWTEEMLRPRCERFVPGTREYATCISP